MCFITYYLSIIQTFHSYVCIFFLFLSFVRKNYCIFEADNLVWCIRTLHSNASMPLFTPSLLWVLHLRQRRLGGQKEARHNKRRLLDALFETDRNLANSLIVVLNLATVDAPGVIYPSVWFIASHHCTLLGAMCLCIYAPRGYDYHIGVGSDVVCSTTIGNARASISGTDNR